MAKKKGKKKKNVGKTRPIIIVSDTVPMSMVKSQVLSSVMRKEPIDSLIMFTKKADEKVLDGIDKKMVQFRLHEKYELHDKNGEVIKPNQKDDKSFCTYRISFKQFLKAVAADLVNKDIWFITHYGDSEKDAKDRKEASSIYAIDTSDKKGADKKLYVFEIAQLVGEVLNKKKKKIAYIRFDL